jgi:hypothetical protein
MGCRAIRSLPRIKRGPPEEIYHSIPPPSVKSISVGGVQNTFWAIDLRACFRAADLCTLFMTHSRPPPPSKIERMGGGPKSNTDHRSERLILSCLDARGFYQ